MSTYETLSFVSDEEFEKRYNFIKSDITRNLKSVDTPIAVVLGGQPGSGKGNLYGLYDNLLQKNIAKVDCDAFRKYHPHFKELFQKYGENDNDYTQDFIGKVTKRLVSELSDEKYNMIIESTLRTPTVAMSIRDQITPKGYQVILGVMATPKEVSYQGTINRQQEMIARGEQPRAVSKEFHDSVVDSIGNSLETVYNSGKMANILIYNRNKECLYDMSKTPEVNPRNILENVIHGNTKTKEPKTVVLRVGNKEFFVKPKEDIQKISEKDKIQKETEKEASKSAPKKNRSGRELN